MDKKDIKFLKELCEAPSPSGFEVPAANVVRAKLGEIGADVSTNVLGSVHGVLKGKGKANFPSIMIAGHIDELGLMVTYITDDGFIYFESLGGIDSAILPGLSVNLYPTGTKAKKGEVLKGVIGRKPIHLIEPEERKTVTPMNKLFIDFGLSGKEAKELIRIGDHMVYDTKFEKIKGNTYFSKGFDDKLGIYIAVKVLEEVKKRGGYKGDLIAAGTVQEEIGLRGGVTSSYQVNPEIGISAEVGHATDYPGIEKTKTGDAKLGGGPIIARGPNINPVLFNKFVESAERTKTPYHIGPESRATGTDANPIQLSRGGKIAGLISVPLRYMHTQREIVNLKDIDGAVTILTDFVLNIKQSDSFIPS